jgi:hypothetical protein
MAVTSIDKRPAGAWSCHEASCDQRQVHMTSSEEECVPVTGEILGAAGGVAAASGASDTPDTHVLSVRVLPLSVTPLLPPQQQQQDPATQQHWSASDASPVLVCILLRWQADADAVQSNVRGGNGRTMQ